MKSTFSIRLAQISDGETIGKFQIACAKESENRQLNYRAVEAGVMRILSLQSTHASLGDYLVAENESGEVVACCLLQRIFSEWTCSFYMLIESVYVHSDYRGQGLLQQMYQSAESIARRTGEVSEIRSTVSRENKPMHWALGKVAWEESLYVIFSKKL